MSALTETETAFLRAVMMALKQPPDFDVDKVAEQLNIKPKSVKHRWWTIRKKLFADVEPTTEDAGSSGDQDAAPKTPKRKQHPLAVASSSSKRAKLGQADGNPAEEKGGDTMSTDTPTGGKGKKVKKELSEDA
ncbi:hypothetical protein GQ53DRAFT_746021 [Thozetella sp. PMI_491]|nr:hypothetical protein GQ53DRAFT_746021 [Thozetella sp. PMI_491]